ncbi:hypothetical protein FVB9288_00841 [Flavobacterium sp. CECT 9288]|uniref:DKNYY domain-containing protein n=1 Tax=Flavobacterium sp. CECT 9288 TaxID=2845819 RepID=UPI001E2BCA96|nr:DKNYY domain-containing protein [Flavobacterium sp. CECT 9288]CAH0335208.1 hypothetical protein FVB9288_00841 [Flavobacterium sp. CECT 9288]
MKYSPKYLFILLIFTISLTSCHSGYEEKDGKIYFKWIHGGNWTRENALVKGADAETFETIDNDINIHLGKDKNHVYKDASILEHADPKTFEQVKEYYWKDRKNVYLLQFGGTDCRIKNVDPKTFKVLKDNNWTLDKNNVYYEFEKLNAVNPKTFVQLNEIWGKDNQYYYFKNLRLDALDYESAEIVIAYFMDEPASPSEYIKDKENVYFQNKIVKGANPKTFKADGVGSFGHDDKFMFNCEKNEGPITVEYKQTYIDSENKNSR